MLARSSETSSLNVMIIYPEILGHSYSRFDLLKSITIASFHLVHGWNKGKGHAVYRPCSCLLLCMFPLESHWIAMLQAPHLFLWYSITSQGWIFLSWTFSGKVGTYFSSPSLWWRCYIQRNLHLLIFFTLMKCGCLELTWQTFMHSWYQKWQSFQFLNGLINTS